MLTYLINVTDDLLTLSVIIGVTASFIDWHCRNQGKALFRTGIALGFFAALIRAYITNTRRISGGWRIGAYGYGAALTLFVLLLLAFAVFSRSFYRKSGSTRLTGLSECVISALIGLLSACYLYGALPNVFVYPFKFNTGGNGILSTDYLFRLGGYLLGVAVSLVSASAAYHLLTLAAQKGFSGLLRASFYLLTVMYAVYNFARLMLVLTPRKIVNSIRLFKFAAASNNHSAWYAYTAFLVLTAAAAVIWIRSYTAKEPYKNKAERRKQRAVWRSGKRYSVVMAACFACGILCTTWFVKLNTVVIRETPTEEPILQKDGSGEDAELWVPLEAVADGHLHRFGYTTKDGYLTRFIVIQKQANTNNYGIGLDACDICGEAGYYENRDGQVVCKKCAVVMNRTTIGMKGGCNPIIIDYDINENYITVPVSEMMKNQKKFKK